MNQNVKEAAARKAYAVMIFDGLCVSSGSVILSLLRNKYNLSYDFAGTLLAILSLGNLVSGFLCAALPRFLGMRMSALIMTSGLAIGYFLLALSGNPFLLLLGFLAIGFGKGSTMNNGVVVAGQAAKDKTRCTNLINALFALGSLLAPILYLACSNTANWKMPLYALTVSGLIVLAMFAMMGLSSDRNEAKKDNDMSFLQNRHFWYSVCYLFCELCTEISVTGWVVTYFKDQGILTGSLSELTVTVVWMAMLIGRLIIAFVLPADSKLRSLLFMSIFALIGYVLLLTARNGYLALFWLFVFGVGEAGCYPTGIAQAGKSLSNAVMGILLPFAGVGSIVMPYIVGAVAERFGIWAGMVCPAISIVGMIFFAILLKKEK